MFASFFVQKKIDSILNIYSNFVRIFRCNYFTYFLDRRARAMLMLTFLFGCVFSLFFYCQALTSGLGVKRWAFAGFVFGPFLWPMFCVKKRMKLYQQVGFNCLILRA